MTTAIQEALRSGAETLSSMTEKFGIKVKRHGKYDHIVLLKYDQVESQKHFHHQLVRECRGIILNETDNWNIVSFAFAKFFNSAESLAATIDWATVRVFDKVDGSLACMYAYDGQWLVSTTGLADASGNVSDYGFTFDQLFWKTFRDLYKGNLPPVDCGKCFFFELTSPYNKVVVVHSKPSLTVLGGRDLRTLKEMTPEEASSFFPGIPVVREFPLRTIDEVLAAANAINPLANEGFVICDANFNRVKCKSPKYVALHHLKDNLSSRRSLVKVMLDGELEEVSAALPEYKDVLFDAKDRYDRVVSELEAAYDEFRDIEMQKEFAFQAVKTRCPGALFQLRAKKVSSIGEHLRNIHIDNVIRLLGYKDPEAEISVATTEE